jgi:hypothetical protein
MVASPSATHSLEGVNQGFNGDDGQDGGFRTRFGGQVSTCDGDVSDQAGENFDLAVADVSRQASKA